MNNLTVRLLTEEDKNNFERLYTESVLTGFPEYSKKTRYYFVDEKYKGNMWKQPIKLGAFVDGALVGYLVSDRGFGGVAFVHWIAVSELHQGQGIGRGLLMA